jgi:hypothetical protein
LALTPEDLDAVPAVPGSGVDHLAAPLQSFLKERIPAQDQAWLIGHSDHWEQTTVRALLAKWTGAKADAPASLTTWGVCLRFEDMVRLTAAFHCRTDQAARALAESVKKVWAAPPQAKPEPTDGWVTVDGKSSPEDLRAALRQAAAGMVQVSNK